MDIGEVIYQYKIYFGSAPDVIAHAGGRVNIIGEHTDYHEGFVLPSAINLRTYCAGVRSQSKMVRCFSANVNDYVEFSTDEISPKFKEIPLWARYVVGVLWALKESGIEVRGMNIFITGEVPLGGGLSSSASLEVALAGLSLALIEKDCDPMEIARIARKAENEFCGIPCGPMDQITSACGQEGSVILIDCRSFELKYLDFPKEWTMVVIDSGVRHFVSQGEYAKRQAQCAEGLEKIRKYFPDIKTARDLEYDLLLEFKRKLSDLEFRRLRHVVTENQRVLSAISAILNKDSETMGRLLVASHESLQYDYEVSCSELDMIVDVAQGTSGIIGARLTGAGFGGNTISLVWADRIEDFCADVQDRLAKRTGKIFKPLHVLSSKGLEVIRND